MENYDEIIGKVITSMHKLRSYAVKNEPQKVAEIDEIIRRVVDVDYFMAYGEDKVN
jgi:hypothetical protein